MTALDPRETQKHWDGLADGYDAAKARNDVYYDSLKRLIGAAVPEGRRRRVLDVGCGTGQILASLRPVTGVGIDASPNMIERAVAGHADRSELTFRVGDAGEVDRAGVFDVVVSADLLEHVPDWRVVIRSAVAACAPGGRLVLTTPNPSWALPLWVLEKTRLKMPEGPHRFVPLRRIVAALREERCLIVSARTHLLVPTGLGGLGPRLSTRAERLPLLRRLGVIQLVVAERPAEAS